MNNITKQKILELIPKGERIVWIPNPGNAGDSIIALGMLHFFEENDIIFEIGDIDKQYYYEFLIYGGGGNLIPSWDNCKNFLFRNKEKNKIIVFPHTIHGVDNLLDFPSIKENVTFFCREKISYEYVKRFTDNVYLEHDMAFSISEEFISKYDKESSGILNCFRADEERTEITIPTDNQDISYLLNDDVFKIDLDIVERVSHNFFSKISEYSTIHTNRLHVGIVASLLNKEVFLYPNNYYKNKAVYEYSLKDKYPKTTFVDG